MNANAVLARAKQGEPGAIAALMNNMLKAQGAQVQVKRRGHEYKILISSAQVPDQVKQVQWIAQGLAKLAIADMQTVTIYGKSHQSPQPNWQQQITFPLAAGVVRSQPNASPEHAAANAPKTTATKLENTAPDGGAAAPPSESHNESNGELSGPPADQPQPPGVDLSEHCFTRNASLVKVSLDPPAAAVGQVVLTFAALSDEQKLALLPHCQKLFRKPEPVEDDALSAETQALIATIVALEGNDLRKLSIWLSRYCAHPVKTVEELTPKPPEPEPEPSEPEPDVTDEGHTSAHSRYSRTASHGSVHQLTDSPVRPNIAEEPVMFARGRLPVWLLPTIWAVGLMIAIALGIRSVPDTYVFPMCDGSSASPEVCTLAVQIVGIDEEWHLNRIVNDAKPIPITEQTTAQAMDDCRSVAYWQARDADELDGVSSIKEQFDVMEITANQTHTLFPGVLLMDITQRNSQSASAMSHRFACLVQTGESLESATYRDQYPLLRRGENGLSVFALATIPINWPEAPYGDLSEKLKDFKALGIYNVFITFGASTIFTAIGIFVAVILCSCYRCHTLSGVYQMAGALAMVEAVMSAIPGLNLFISLPMDVLAIGIASRFVKDFHVDWQSGFYGSFRTNNVLIGMLATPVGRGAFVIITIRKVLLLLLQLAIVHMIS